MTRLISPIKYFGGKYYMTNILLNNIPNNYDCYIEVFGGSGALLFAKEPTSKEIYNDLENGVYSLFKCISDANLFYKLKNRLDLTYYHSKIREELLSYTPITILDKAYKFFVLNRLSYNGMGGFSRNLIIRRHMSKSVSDYLSAIDRLPEIHQRLSGIIIENMTFEDIIHKYDKKGNFMYLDPPYIQSTRQSNQKYLLDMTDDQHEKLVNIIIESKSFFLISGYKHPIYNKLEHYGFNIIDFISPNSKSNAIETLWKNY